MANDSPFLILSNENGFEEFLKNLKDCGSHLAKLRLKYVEIIKEVDALWLTAPVGCAGGPVLAGACLVCEILINKKIFTQFGDALGELYAAYTSGIKLFDSAWKITSEFFSSFWGTSEAIYSLQDVTVNNPSSITIKEGDAGYDSEVLGSSDHTNGDNLDFCVI